MLSPSPLEIDQPSVSAFEEEVPLSPGPWCHQEFSSLDQEVQQASLLLQVKEEEEEKEEQEMRKQGLVEELGLNNLPFTACTNL